MKKIIQLFCILLSISCSKQDIFISTNTETKPKEIISEIKMPFHYDFQKAVRCFNDKPIEYENEFLDIDNDNIPDFIGVNNNINSESLIITDSNFKTIKSFNIWQKIPNRFKTYDPVRKCYVTDSLNTNSTAVGDLNNDGYKDVIINLLGEWGTPANVWYGGKTYIVKNCVVYQCVPHSQNEFPMIMRPVRRGDVTDDLVMLFERMFGKPIYFYDNLPVHVNNPLEENFGYTN